MNLPEGVLEGQNTRNPLKPQKDGNNSQRLAKTHFRGEEEDEEAFICRPDVFIYGGMSVWQIAEVSSQRVNEERSIV